MTVCRFLLEENKLQPMAPTRTPAFGRFWRPARWGAQHQRHRRRRRLRRRRNGRRCTCDGLSMPAAVASGRQTSERRWPRLPTCSVAAAGTTITMARDRQGRSWLMTTRSMRRYHRRRMQSRQTAEAPQVAHARVRRHVHAQGEACREQGARAGRGPRSSSTPHAEARHQSRCAEGQDDAATTTLLSNTMSEERRLVIEREAPLSHPAREMQRKLFSPHPRPPCLRGRCSAETIRRAAAGTAWVRTRGPLMYVLSNSYGMSNVACR